MPCPQLEHLLLRPYLAHTHARTHTHTRARVYPPPPPPHTLFRRYAVYKYLVHTTLHIQMYSYVYTLSTNTYSFVHTTLHTHSYSFVHTLRTYTYSFVHSTLHIQTYFLMSTHCAQTRTLSSILSCTQIMIRAQSSIPCILIQHTATQGMTLPCTSSRQLKYLLSSEEFDLIKVSRLSV